MSRFYSMTVTVSNYDPEKEAQIQEAAEEDWPFADWWRGGEAEMQASGQDNLCGGATEEDFTKQLSLAIWKANEAYCDVTVNATCLESLPFDTHTLSKEDYARLMNE